MLTRLAGACPEGLSSLSESPVLCDRASALRGTGGLGSGRPPEKLLRAMGLPFGSVLWPEKLLPICCTCFATVPRPGECDA